jgi:general secretion pathway protein F
MAAFDYIALDSAGRRRKGVMEADSARQLRQNLRASALTPLEVREVGGEKTSRKTRRMSMRDVSVFTRQFATLTQAGLPVAEALGTLARQSGDMKMEGIVSAIRTQVMEGKTLAESLSAFPQAFSGMYRTSIAAGERTGHLEMVLGHLADFSENSWRARQKVMLALLYPAILTVVSLLIVLFLMTFVVPDMIRVFTGTGHELPLLTRGLIAISYLLQHWGLALAALIAAGAYGVAQLLKRPDIRLKLDERMLRWPLIGPLVRQCNTARFAATLGMLQDSGVPLVQAIEIAGSVLASPSMREKVNVVATQVAEGIPFSRALERSNTFPPLLSTMVASGEASGQLGGMLTHTGSISQKDFESRVAVILGLFEPMVLLLMGVIVLLLVLAIILPILNLNQMVS